MYGRRYKAGVLVLQTVGNSNFCSVFEAPISSLGKDLDDCPHHAAKPIASPLRHAQQAPQPYDIVYFDIGDTLGQVKAEVLPDGSEMLIFTPFPYTVDVLRDLKMRGVKLGICSNTGKYKTDTGLDMLGSLSLVFEKDLCLFSGELGFSKSDRRFWALAVGMAKVAPSRILFVGESKDERDRAQAAGMAVLEDVRLLPPTLEGVAVSNYLFHASPEEFLRLSEKYPQVVIYPESTPRLFRCLATPSQYHQLKSENFHLQLASISDGGLAHLCGVEKKLIPAERSSTPFTEPLSLDPDVLTTIQDTITVDRMERIVQYITGPTFASNRSVYSPKMAQLEHALEQEFLALGHPSLKVTRRPFSYRTLELNNIEAELVGEKEHEIVVVGAHLDSTSARTFAGTGTPYNPREAIAPGADDDASGVAAVLLIARACCLLFRDKKPACSIRFVLFNCEEEGLVGSRYYARDARLKRENIVAMVQMDMIGYTSKLSKHTIEIHSGTDHAPDIVAQGSWKIATTIMDLQRTLMKAGLVTIDDVELFSGSIERDPASGLSDHASFHIYGYPAIAISENSFDESGNLNNPSYHTIEDTSINLDFATQVARIVGSYVISLGFKSVGAPTLKTGVKGVSLAEASKATAISESSLAPIDPEMDKNYLKVPTWFLGPKGENRDRLLKLVSHVINEHCNWRKNYFPQDPPYLTQEMRDTLVIREEEKKLEDALNQLLDQLENSMPFFSQRYKGHMNFDISMVGLLGYFASSLWNNNNVAREGAPIATLLEKKVSEQLCEMMGYPSTSWGHITSCGSIANIEALWAARNAKYLPFALKSALALPELEAYRNTEFTTAMNEKKRLDEMTEWELLNLPTNNLIETYTALSDKFRCDTNGNLVDKLASYDISHRGLNELPGKQGIFTVPATRHYSWDKAGALLGLGQSNMKLVDVDEFARQDLNVLRQYLDECVNNEVPVYAVVVVVGSTAEGAVDPVSGALQLREEYRRKGLDFYLHVDAAWGGYFCTLLHDAPVAPFRAMKPPGYVPPLALNPYTEEQLKAMRDSDSITVDPHKSGYIQYPAGALCYRNGSIRYLLSFKAPIVGIEEDDSMGFYGIEGSKPAAAVVATYLHHQVVGLNKDGHGRLLSQANFTTQLINIILRTLDPKNDAFWCMPLQALPDDFDTALLDKIKNMEVIDIARDEELMKQLGKIGPDLMINCFSLNFSWPFKLSPGVKAKRNTETQRVNDVIFAIADELNATLTDLTTDVFHKHGMARKKLFVIRNVLGEEHRRAALTLRERLRLDVDDKNHHDLACLVSTNMDPWPTPSFLETFRFELRQAILRGIGSVMEPTGGAHGLHGFIATDAGDADIFGNHLPVFSIPHHQYHAIIKMRFVNKKGDAPDGATKESALKLPTNGNPLVVLNRQQLTLKELFYRNAVVEVDLLDGFPQPLEDGSFANAVGKAYVKVVDVVLFEHFDPITPRPHFQQYLVYGTGNYAYASHCMSRYPDYHYVAELRDVPPEFTKDSRLLDYGVKVTVLLSELPPTATPPSEPPLELGKSYEAVFIGEYGVSKNMCFTVSKHVWYDGEKLNETHANEDGGHHPHHDTP